MLILSTKFFISRPVTQTNMLLKLYFCDNENYSNEFILCEVNHQIIYHPTKGSIEVALDTSPPVFGHSKDNQKFSIMLYSVEYGKSNPDYKYFSKVGWATKQRLLYQFRNTKPLLYFLQGYSPQIALVLFGYSLSFLFPNGCSNTQSNQETKVEKHAESSHQNNSVKPSTATKDTNQIIKQPSK